jgi:predicted ABC-type sugar transport system permease subunit
MDDGIVPWLVCLMLSSKNVVWSIIDHGKNGADQGAFGGNKRTHEGVDVVVAECSSLGTARF